MAEILSIVSIVAFSLAGVDILILFILWFKFDMLKIMGDLSGRNEKRSIARMHRDRPVQPALGEAFYQEFRGQPLHPPESGSNKAGQAKSYGAAKLFAGVERSAVREPSAAERSVQEKPPLEENTDLGETTLLGTTEILEETSLLEENTVLPEAFTLVENILMVHTEERI